MCKAGETIGRGSTGLAGIYYYQFAKPFYEIDSGTICIDNENIENYTLITANKLRWYCKMYSYLVTPFSITLH
jgi:hypothetical protein